ncbi:AraC family transcriptional regulator [Kaistia dalseonensis]|uniref:AraC-like DNA-binding protein n=1 Tax=Kaistia dalseonensis TaxID=410840 RepID=A0ABU0H2N2_9HYPH|nr:AraC family transcriptional regulator [Kaistia dalseonensis]MCX5493989.1 AraC family transcriptional regulator [Kaistia dalseonensis]MDQ0436565.1 AraC-like DNA-binding protein [Kaistia dalseonensis]
MLFVPIPFVVALLLILLLIALLRRGDEARGSRSFLALIALCAIHSVIVGLRWGYGIAELRYPLPILAACLPPLTFVSFRSLVRDERPSDRPDYVLYAAPPLLIIGLFFTWPILIDLVLIVLFIAYAIAILALGRSGPDALDEARFDDAVAAYRALRIAAAALCMSALFDLLVFIDFEWTKGTNAAALVSNANLLGLLLIGLTASVAGRSRAMPETTAPEPIVQPPPVLDSAADRDVLTRIDGMMRAEGLYRDANLNLSRLARRAGMPARQISGAVNRLTGSNVSQYVNDFRIAEACRLLAETDHTVTTIMFESGFQTKSNFNREFRRVTGLAPAAWRDEAKVRSRVGPAGTREARPPPRQSAATGDAR